MLENFKAKIFGQGERDPNPEEEAQLRNLAEEIIRQEREIGRGNYSIVFNHPEHNCCYKVGTQKAVRGVHEETEFLEKLHGKSDKVIVPKPLWSMSAKIKNVGKMPTSRSIIAMQVINGANFEEILKKGTKKLPDNFDFEKFFTDLEEFFKYMHEEEGIYHCDFADRNLMVDYETGKPVLIDFGAATNKSLFTTDELKEKKQYEGGRNDDTELESLKNQVRLYLTKGDK